MVKFVGDVVKPILTLLVTVVGLAFIASVVSPRADAMIEAWIPAWSSTEPAKDQVRDWLGLREEDDAPWWQFWDRD